MHAQALRLNNIGCENLDYMMVYRFFLSMMSILFATNVAGDIRKIHSFRQASQVLASADHSTLVLFDVDATITVPGSPMLWANVIKNHSQWLEQLYDEVFKKSERSKEYLQSIWQDQEIPALVESDIVHIIANLQERKVPVFALTAIMTGSHYSISSLTEWRYAKLKQVSIDFTHEDFSDHVFTNLPVHNEQYPLFYKGILFSTVVSKGDVLGAFLDRIEWEPTLVIFFDDNLMRVQEVESEMTKRKIPFIGYHYHGIECLADRLDKEIAAFQLNYLVQHEHWITEDEASILLKAKSDF